MPSDYRDELHAAKKICEDAGDTVTAGKIHDLMKPVDKTPLTPERAAAPLSKGPVTPAETGRK